jgi:hypothetical protein
MQIEIVIVAVIIFAVMTFTGRLELNKLFADNEMLFRKLKEDDWDFLVRAKHGDRVSPDVLFAKRIKNGFLIIMLALLLLLKNLSLLTAAGAVIAGFGVFKLDYLSYKSHYKRHLHEIDNMLPYYLKSLEILIQHYTVPVAIGKSMNDAPTIFKDGLQQMINQINAGDDTIEPYMQFARTYSVRDSMRMMRLLYRLSIGRQERKQEQLMTFSKTISNLQQKARETRYKERLDKMEGMTMRMLITTGLGVMVLLLISVIQMMGI